MARPPTLRTAAIQMRSGPRLADNLEVARARLAEAAAGGAELAALPEWFCFLGHADTDKLAIAEADGDGSIQAFLARAARDLGLWIVGGSLPVRTGDPARVRNASMAYRPDGERVARYDKIHRFRLESVDERFDETRTIEAGDAPVAFDLAARDGGRWRIGLSICYDLRFPELYRALAADVLLVPSAFTHRTGEAHWEPLLRARAIENLAWVVAPAQGGTHENGRRTWGRTMVVDPWGRLAAARDHEREGVVFADLDRGAIDDARRQLPALAHRVLDDPRA